VLELCSGSAPAPTPSNLAGSRSPAVTPISGPSAQHFWLYYPHGPRLTSRGFGAEKSLWARMMRFMRRKLKIAQNAEHLRLADPRFRDSGCRHNAQFWRFVAPASEVSDPGVPGCHNVKRRSQPVAFVGRKVGTHRLEVGDVFVTEAPALVEKLDLG
jgi:hypothetical protein